ncbi:hypothetical protein EVG20_g5989 [Dentipellis fragilis]|uniref:Transcription elongation factor SPT4 n=1 Tax=Dentipellis fragilis TaxID=205917 RepID=A0A4Y9YPH6_9AGAM|nr:hypothetical protein EVG20_g5989 [Dentipellis fragilis]
MSAMIPSQARGKTLRACLLCSIIQSPADFRRNGCPNCEELMQVRLLSISGRQKGYLKCDFGYLQMKSSPDRIQVCTTTYFDGVIAVIDPETSWVARWQRTSKYVRGMYAVRVKGRIPDDVEAELESRGIKYRPRDQTDQD